MKKTDEIVQDYKDAHDNSEPQSIDLILSLSYLLGFMAIFLASVSLNYQTSFFGGAGDPATPVWHIRPLPFPVFEVIYFCLGVLLVGSTWSGRGLSPIHLCSAVMWTITGITWIAYGIIYRPDYVFAFGVIGIFLAAQHIIVARIWTLERVA